MRSLLPSIVAIAVAFTGANAIASVTDLPAGAVPTGLEALPGEIVHIVGRGDLVIQGTITTTAGTNPGSSGPDIIIESDGTLTLLPGATIVAGSGRVGKSVTTTGSAEAGSGGRGGDVILRAPRIIAQGALLRAGDGGDGGVASAFGNPNATARGGDGGRAGDIVIESRIVSDTPTRLPNRAGNGGSAAAGGENAGQCNPTRGSDSTHRGRNATINGGSGENGNATSGAGTCGPIDGTGGAGGDAHAFGGNGGTSQDGNGGHGGNATAIAGKGADGADACFATFEEGRASGIRHAGNGGPGGFYESIGGDGGHGRNGGHGGSAYGWNGGGKGGNATNPIVAGAGGGNAPLTRPAFYHGVKGGAGGAGLLGVGGNGGNALGESYGGGSGSYCDASGTVSSQVPGPSPSLLVAAIAGMALFRRSRNQQNA